jgi:hypothetical protein
MCWNQLARVDYLRKKWRAAQKKLKIKKGQADLVQASTHSWRATAGQHLDRVGLVHFLIFLIFLMLPPTLWSTFYWKFGEWARAFGRMGA